MLILLEVHVDGKTVNNISGQQVAIGLTGGTITGAILGRVSKGAAIVVGSSLVVVTLANSYGLLDDFDRRSL